MRQGAGRRGPRGLLRAGSSAGFLLAMMFAGSLGLWVGLPVAWLWIGGRVQAGTGSLGVAILVIFAGFVVCVGLSVRVLSWLSHRYDAARAARGLEAMGPVALEGVMVVSALIAVVLFAAWFFFLSGAEPIPLNLQS